MVDLTPLSYHLPQQNSAARNGSLRAMQTRSSNALGVTTRQQSSGPSTSQVASHARTNARAVSQQQQQHHHHQDQQRSRPRRSLSDGGTFRPQLRSPSPGPGSPAAASSRPGGDEDDKGHAADNRRRVASIDTGTAQSRHGNLPLNSPDSGSHICLCTREPKIPRPRNAFILYRQNKQAQVAARNPGLPNPEISKIIGRQWRQETEEVKNFWRHNAVEEKRNHEKQYPGYKYTPRRGTKTGLSALKNLSLSGDPYSPAGDSGTGSNHCPKCGGRFISMPATPGLTSTTTDSQTDTPYTPAMPTAVASSMMPPDGGDRRGPPPSLHREAWDYGAPDHRGGGVYGRDVDMSPRRRVNSLYKRALGEAPDPYSRGGDPYYYSDDYGQMMSPSKRPRHYSDEPRRGNEYPGSGYDDPPPPPPHHYYGPPRRPSNASHHSGGGGAKSGSSPPYSTTPRHHYPPPYPQQHQQQQQAPPRDWQYGRNAQQPQQRKPPSLGGAPTPTSARGPSPGALPPQKPRVASAGPGYPSPSRPSPAMAMAMAHRSHPRSGSMSPRRRAVTQGALSPRLQSRMPPPPPPLPQQQQQQQPQQRLPAVRALDRPIGPHESLRLPPLKTHNVPPPPPPVAQQQQQQQARSDAEEQQQQQQQQQRLRRESSQASPPHYATQHGSVVSQGEVERRTVEAMVMTIPYPNKIDTLLNISPPLAPPAPGSPAEAAVQTRGPVIAVEGTAVAPMMAVGDIIRDELERSGECAVGVWRNVEGVPGSGAGPAGPARREGDAVVPSDEEGEKGDVAAEKQQQQQQQPEQPKAGEGDTTAAGGKKPAAADGDVEMSGAAPAQTPTVASNNPQQQQQQQRRRPNPWLAYMSVIQKWHVKSEEMIKFITTKPPPSPPSPSSSGGNSNNSNNNNNNNNNKTKIPVALIQGGYQLMAADRWATRVPIADAYAPVDHWQWMATLWRGIVGPDLFVYVRKSPPEDVEALGVVEFKGPRLMVVRVAGQQQHQQQMRLDEKTERRVRFEVMEWVRAGSYRRGFGRFL